jgi:hypothetical protein
MAETRGGVAAIFDTPFGDQKCASVVDREGGQLPCRGPHVATALVDPSCRV